MADHTHGLGRIPSPEDPRDFKMADELVRRQTDNTDFSPYLDGSLRQMLAGGAIKSWRDILAFWRWLKTWIAGNPTPTPDPTPTPTPTPTPAPTSVEWADAVQLDQGQTGHCVGFGSTAFLNADPLPHGFDDDFAHTLYYACKVIDGQPRKENGSSVRSAAKALTEQGYISKYFFAASVEEITQWVLNHGPVVMGTDWDNDMFNPDSFGFVRPGGGLAGGHCFLLVGYDQNTNVYRFDNSWGTGWGQNGQFRMHAQDFRALFARDGSEAMAADEVV